MANNNVKTTSRSAANIEADKKRREILKRYSWKPGQSGNPNGRPKQFKSQFAQCPHEIQDKIRDRLFQALTCGDKDDALAILNATDGELGEYGIVLQVAARGLVSKAGMATLQQIYEILFGRLPQTNVNVDVDEDKKDAFIKGVFIP